MGRHECCAAGLHQAERFVAERGLMTTDHPFGQSGRVVAVEGATTPGGCMVEAMPHEQMGMFEAALACLYRVFQRHRPWQVTNQWTVKLPCFGGQPLVGIRSEEHTSELQSQSNLVCRLLLEKKKKQHT